MLYPDNLEKGYEIGVTATSAGFEAEVDFIRLESGIKHFEELGYPVIITDNVRKNLKGRSSDGPTRARELLQLITDSSVRAVIAASGGEYLLEMLPYVDFDQIKANPKWIQGYSDTTGILFTITTNLDIATLYANNFGCFGMKPWHSSLSDNLKILEGKDIMQKSYDKYQDGYREKITGYEGFFPEKDVFWINHYPTGADPDKELIIEGRALGGCLDPILNLIGTRFDKTRDFIDKYKQDKICWFLESFDLTGEALFRGLWQLKEAGWFEHAAGFVFGRPAFYPEDSDFTFEETVLSVLGEYNLPIILEADIGHKPPQFAMINGAIAKIRSFNGKGCIKFERR